MCPVRVGRLLHDDERESCGRALEVLASLRRQYDAIAVTRNLERRIRQYFWRGWEGIEFGSALNRQPAHLNRHALAGSNRMTLHFEGNRLTRLRIREQGDCAWVSDRRG